MSPILFSIYIDELLNGLGQSAYGCHIGNMFLGTIAYADDITLLAPTTTSISRLLTICSTFAREYNVLFNPAKSKHLSFDQCTNENTRISFENSEIESVQWFKHLGHIIGPGVAKVNMQEYIRAFNVDVNLLMAQFKHIYSTTRYQLFKTYCMPLYGAQLWDFSGKEVETFFTAWRKAIRHIWKLPYTCHSNLLHIICNDYNIESQMHIRFLKFFHTLSVSKNNVVQFMAKSVYGGSQSVVCKSLNHIFSKYCIKKPPNLIQLDCFSIINRIRQTPNCDEQSLTLGHLIRELCEIRDGAVHCMITRHECVEIINEISTT